MVTIHTICNSAVEIGHEVMKKSLNNIDFTDFFGKRMLKSLFSIRSTNFHRICYFKAEVVYSKRLPQTFTSFSL